jgi:hypothetical protein
MGARNKAWHNMAGIAHIQVGKLDHIQSVRAPGDNIFQDVHNRCDRSNHIRYVPHSHHICHIPYDRHKKVPQNCLRK